MYKHPVDDVGIVPVANVIVVVVEGLVTEKAKEVELLVEEVPDGGIQ